MTVTIDDVDDRVAQILTAGPGITITYSDLLDAITIATHREPEAIHDAVAELLQAGSGITLTYDDNANTLTIAASVDSATLGEIVDDQVAQLVQAGENMTIVYDDNAGTLTFTAAGAPPAPDEVLVSPSAPSDPNTELWFDPTGTPVTAPTPLGQKIGPAGYWVWALQTMTNISTGAMTIGRMQAMRWRIDQAFDAIGWQVTTAAAATTINFGIYAVDNNAMPTSLLRSGSVESATIGVKTMTFSPLPAGTYWLGMLSLGGGPQTYTVAGLTDNYVSPTTTPNFSTAGLGWSVNGMVAIPDPFPSNPANITGVFPCVQVRLA